MGFFAEAAFFTRLRENRACLAAQGLLWSMSMAPADLKYREHPVHPALAPFVKVLWSLESERPIHNAPRERILPDGCVEFVIHYRDPLRTYHGHAPGSVQPRALVVGQMRQFLELEPAGRVGFVAVRFHVRGAYRFFRGPLSDAAGRDANLEDLWGNTARELADRIAEARGMAARLRLVDAALLDSVRANARRDAAVDRCLHLIEQADGRLNIRELAPEIGLSQRHLSRRFQEAVGTSPKEFARTRRFLLAVRTLGSGRCRMLTDTAHACGYFDQAHFNHEFRELAGMTPGQFFSFPNRSF